MKYFRHLIFGLLFGLSIFSGFAQTENAEASPCFQDKTEKLQLLKKAEENQYNVRYIQLFGNTYTRYPTFRKQWEKSFEEGSIFTQKSLMKSIAGTNKLKTIKPISLDNIKVRLQENDARGWNAIDFDICVQQIEVFLTDAEKLNLIKLIEEAESNRYRVRRIEIVGNATIRHRVFVDKMAFVEGDIFTRKLLEKSIKNVSKIKQIYPIRLENVEVRVDRKSRDIDLVFVVVER